MSEHPVTDEVLLAFATGELSGDQRESVADHVTGCQACMNTVAMFRSVRDVVIADAAIAVSPTTLTRIKNLMPATPATPSIGQAITGVIRRIMADLVVDGRHPLAAAGLRGGGDGYNLVYSVGETDIDLRCEPADVERDRWSITGQVSLSGEPREAVIAFIPISHDGEPALTDLDEFGMFALSVNAGTYNLIVRRAEEEIILPAVDVG